MAKRVLLPTDLIQFNPAAQYIEFNAVPNFDCRKVLAIIDITVQQTLIYAVSSTAQGLGGGWSDSGSGYPTMLDLQYDTTVGFGSNDLLQIIYDDGEVGIYDANNVPIYSSPDNLSERNGLDINLLNGSVIGQVNQALDDPYGDSAMSVAFNQGGTLKSPRMDPVTDELMTKVVTNAENPVYVNIVGGGGGGGTVYQGSFPWSTSLVDSSNSPLNTDYGNYGPQTLRVVLAANQPTLGIGGTVSISTSSFQDLSATYTGSGNSSTFSSSTFPSQAFQLWVGTVTGTNPTMDLKIQETFDGSQWFDIYHFPRITTSSTVFQTPPIRMTGTSYRYVRTVAGTTPSFSGVVINRLARSGVNASVVRNFFDRSINLNTLNSVSGSYPIGGCNVVEMTVCNGAGGTGTNPHISIEISDDNVNWVTTTSIVTNLAPSTCGVATLSVTQSKFIRAKVTTAGTLGHTLNYVCLKGYGA